MTIESLEKGNEIAKKVDSIDKFLKAFDYTFDYTFDTFATETGILDISDDAFDALKSKVFEVITEYFNAQKCALEKELASL